jgi:hypothetical protein
MRIRIIVFLGEDGNTEMLIEGFSPFVRASGGTEVAIYMLRGQGKAREIPSWASGKPHTTTGNSS